MAPLGESTMIWSALVTVLVYACCCIPMTLSTNVQCIEDINKCRYQCPPGEVQKYCPSLDYKEINNEFCCPGHFRTTTSRCQVCNDVRFMPDVNNCCGCLTCMECDKIVNDTIADSCSPTSNVECTLQTDPTPIATSSCPLMEPTTESPTSSEEVTTLEVNDSTLTPRLSEQKESSSHGLEIGFGVCLAVIITALCCFCIYLRYLAGKGQEVAQSEDTDGGGKSRESLETALKPLARYIFSKERQVEGAVQENGEQDQEL